MENTLYILIGQRIKKARNEKGLTQEAIAKRLDFSTASISNIEKGSQSIYLDDLYKVAEILDADLSRFLPTVKELKKAIPSIDKEIERKGLTSNEKKVVQDVRKIFEERIKD